MKKYLIVLTLVFLTRTAGFGQTNSYHPFPDSNACWNYTYNQAWCWPGSENYSYTISGDTTFNSQTYHKLSIPYVQFNNSGTCLQYHTTGYKGAIRNDLAQRKVFYIAPSELAEQLLYDFSMQVGDTVKGFLESFAFPQDTVQVIDSVLIGDNYRKRWTINYCYGIYLVEGIGSTYGLLELSPGCITDQSWYELTCFNQNGKPLYPDTITNCQIITAANSVDAISNQISIFPNPSNGLITVEFGQPSAIREIKVTSMLGNIILQQKTNDKEKIEIENLPGGLYILTVIYKDNKIHHRKIISHK